MARTFGLDHATLHVHVGMVVWVAGIVIAGSIAALWPMLLAVVAELANELLDRLRTGSWRWRDTIADIVNSVLWPVVLFALARGGAI